MLQACVVCARPSEQARCPTHRYIRARGTKARRQRLRILQRDQYQCRICGAYLDGHKDTHVDHIIPLATGGTTTDSNLQTLCVPCHNRKTATERYVDRDTSGWRYINTEC